MSESAGVLLSVRGDARQTVAPDYGVLAAAIESGPESKESALRFAAAAQDRLTTDLASLGGVPLRQDTERRPLTWSARSATTRAERSQNERTGRYEPTGRTSATVDFLITVRAFDKLGTLSAVLASHEALNIHQVTWHVDWDNPVWPEVRAAAIRAAIHKGRDYAAALGGTLHHVEHLADVGLLGAGDGMHFDSPARGFAMAAARGGAEPDTPSLDPVPQELTATVEARFVAVGVSLAGQQ
jgi:uncharacterized protein